MKPISDGTYAGYYTLTNKEDLKQTVGTIEYGYQYMGDLNVTLESAKSIYDAGNESGMYDDSESDFDFCFIATQDLHLLSDLKMVRKAFQSLSLHLREGGGLSLELILPSSGSFELPKKTFYPRVPNYTDKKVWKESKNQYDAFTKRYYINQVVYIQDEKGITSFPYSVVLQYYEQEEIRSALKDAGFVITGEFQNRNKESWTIKSREWIIEAIKNKKLG